MNGIQLALSGYLNHFVQGWKSGEQEKASLQNETGQFWFGQSRCDIIKILVKLPLVFISLG
jgi:hypothetical protein